MSSAIAERNDDGMAEVFRDPDEDACAPGPGQVFGAVRVVERDWRVGVCFADPVRVDGNVRLWQNSGALEMTEVSRAAGEGPGGVRVLWFDRREYPYSFYLVDWIRDPELGEGVAVVSTGEEIVYDLPDKQVGTLDARFVVERAGGEYVLRVSAASVATDVFVVEVEGDLDHSMRYFMQISDPFGLESCRRESGALFAPVLASADLRFSATFNGYMSSCIAVDGVYFSSPRYFVKAELLDSSGTVLHVDDLWSDDFEVELSARSVSYGQFGAALLAEVNRTRVAAGLHPVALGDSTVAQSHAESMVDGCYASHWGADGLKPYMRYAAAGGVDASAEIWVGTSSFCVVDGDARLVSAGDVLSLAAEAVARWSLSPVHAAVLMSADYRFMSHGLAYDARNWRVVAVFESDLIESTGTSVSGVDSDGRIWASGSLSENAYASGYRLGAAEVRYDVPPRDLSRGQLARTSYYDKGSVLAVLADRAGSRSEDVVVYPNPYAMREVLDPASEEEAYGLFESARVSLGAYTAVYDYLPVEFRLDGRRFELSLPAERAVRYLCVGSGVCSRPTPGVYSVRLLLSDSSGRLVEAGGSSSWVGISRED